MSKAHQVMIHMAAKLFLVTVQDTVLQATGYLIRATNETQAKQFQANGMYIEETSTAVLDTLDTKVVDVTEILTYGEGQER